MDVYYTIIKKITKNFVWLLEQRQKFMVYGECRMKSAIPDKDADIELYQKI